MAPFLASASAEVESLTLETSSHCATAKAIPTTAQIGIRISVPRSGSSVASPIALNDKFRFRFSSARVFVPNKMGGCRLVKPKFSSLYN